eukprot:494455-Rhodomonas_salina.1
MNCSHRPWNKVIRNVSTGHGVAGAYADTLSDPWYRHPVYVNTGLRVAGPLAGRGRDQTIVGHSSISSACERSKSWYKCTPASVPAIGYARIARQQSFTFVCVGR